jgi:hypothetical protein
MKLRIVTSVAAAAVLALRIAADQQRPDTPVERDREGHGTERPLNADDGPGTNPNPELQP